MSAADTEQKILAAATELFTADGYHGTTLVAVAARAGVSERIVYVRFGTKGTLLTRAVEAAVDDGHDWFRVAMAAPTLRERIEQYTAGAAAQLARVAPLMAVATQAEPDEPVVAAAARAGRATSARQVRSFWRALRAERLMNSDSELEWVIATTAVFVLPDTFMRMTAKRGWGPQVYAAWLHRTWTHFATTPGPEHWSLRDTRSP